jgi:exonuclease SbcC
LKEDLAAAGSELKGRLADNATSLRQKEAEALTVQTLDELAAEWAVKRQALEAQVQRVADLQAALRIDDEAAARRRGQGDALEAQKALFAKWESLNGWIGGENGMRFKRYAQGITLRRLLTLATPHVAHMTRDRYKLVWDAKSKELLPDIIDREQGDAQRAVSNLSGGETFMVSLALALGLSAMSSERLNVDTLFLDEGFGTLDDEALSTALDTLTGLKQDGKLIGVISHVQAVKDQIAAQIRIHPGPGGRSTLSGPGVTRLNS